MKEFTPTPELELFKSGAESADSRLVWGFTLIEILIVLTVIGGLISLVSYFAIDISTLQLFIGESLLVDQEIEIGFKIMGPEIRSIGPANNGSYMIEATSSSSFSFYSDVDNDGLFDKVRYFLDGGVFKRGVVRPSGNSIVYSQATEKITEMVHGVISSNIFSYFSKDYNDSSRSSLEVPVDVSAIRVVGVKLRVDSNIDKGPGPQTLLATFTIRNLRGL